MGLWQAVGQEEMNSLLAALNNSINVDKRLLREDISCSVAHAEMLAKQGIISEADKSAIVRGLDAIYDDVCEGRLKIDENAEDVHTFVEETLTKKIGDAGKRLHTARSRNDQVATDFRLFVKHEVVEKLIPDLKNLIAALIRRAEAHLDTVMSGYTHLQKAQPITLSHHLAAYVAMFDRDAERLSDGLKRIEVCPLGGAAFAGTTYDVDRQYTAKALFGDGARPSENSIDGVSDRDFVLETACNLSIVAMHMSRLAEELVLWSSLEFGYIKMDAAWSTGSSIMPQKKNPDAAELVRGKTGRVYGDMVALFVMMKGLPLAYNKDMQEDKELLFDALDTVKLCLKVCAAMIESLIVCEDVMRRSAELGFINATDLADYLVKKGVPFRDAYRLVKEVVEYASAKGVGLTELTLAELKSHSPVFEADVFAEIDLAECVKRRQSYGGTGRTNEYLAEAKKKWQIK